MTQTRRRFLAHVLDEGRARAHLVKGARDLQDAALLFVEHWGDAGTEVRVVAIDADTGEHRCFHIDLAMDMASPCV